MSRLSATLRLDARLQARNRVYPIIAVVTVALALGLGGLFAPDQLRFFMPLVALSGISLTTCFLLGVLILLEREEGTLAVVGVSPLRPAEYIASKMLTLTAVALAESLLLVGVSYGLDFSLPHLALAVVLRAAGVAGVGVALAVRFRSLNDFVVPAAVCILLLDLPVLWYLELVPTPLFYLWPSLPSLLIAKSAFSPVSATELVYAGVYGVAAVGAASLFALRAFDRFVVRGELRT